MPRSAVSSARFLLDPCEFQKHQLCRRLWQKQREILRSVYENPLTAVKGCHASGKTFAAAGLPLSWLVRYKTGKRSAEVLADGGYCSEKNLTALESAEDPSRRVEGSGKRSGSFSPRYLFFPDFLRAQPASDCRMSLPKAASYPRFLGRAPSTTVL